MSRPIVEKIADALLFEGYMLYPYRPSSVKNRQRFNFGVVYPEGLESIAGEGEDAHQMKTECLVEGDWSTEIDVKVRFLQLVERMLDNHQPWQEAVERSIIAGTVSMAQLVAAPYRVPVSPDGGESRARIQAMIEISAEELSPGFFKVRVDISNRSKVDAARKPSRDELLLHSLVSTHTILSVSGGAFVSLLDPPVELRAMAAECHGIRSWPVLVGDTGKRDTMLSSPIIIYDYPAIAAESPGDLFDGTEIDEILSLRILTMTDEEKREMRQSDERARRLLDRTESLDAEDLMRMHGTMRELHPERAEHA